MVLTKGDSGVKAAIGAQKVHVGLAVVTLVGLVNVGLRKDNQACALVIPFHRHLVTFVEGLLRHSSVEVRHVEHFDGRRLALFGLALDLLYETTLAYLLFRNKNSN